MEASAKDATNVDQIFRRLALELMTNPTQTQTNPTNQT